MDRIEQLAALSVRRACAFAVIAICTVMSGLLYDLALALNAGALLTTIGLAVLLYKVQEAPRRDHRKTELWLLLGRESGLPDAVAGRVINAALYDVYRRHAGYAAIAAGSLWTMSLVGSWLA